MTAWCRIAAVGACMIASSMRPTIMQRWSGRRSGVVAVVVVVCRVVIVVANKRNIPSMLLAVVVVVVDIVFDAVVCTVFIVVPAVCYPLPTPSIG